LKKEVRIPVDSLEIGGQFIFPEGREPSYPAIVLCHGIPSGIVDPADGGYPVLAARFAEEGYAVLTFSFRGTGISGGNFDIEGWTHDLEAAIDYIWNLPETHESPLFLVGFSAGAAVSIYVAAQDKRVSGVAACACPADFRTISEASDPQKTLNYFRNIGIIRDSNFPPSLNVWLNSFRKIDALHSVADISPRPLILLHASEDPVVPVSNARELYKKAGEPRKLVIVDGSEHRLRRNDQAMETVIQFFRETCEG
jgi:uncharacterized protein